MNLKQLFRKLNQANEVAAIFPYAKKYSIVVEVDNCFTRKLSDDRLNFNDFNELHEALKYDWNDCIVNGIEEANLELKEENNFTVDGCKVHIMIELN